MPSVVVRLLAPLLRHFRLVLLVSTVFRTLLLEEEEEELDGFDDNVPLPSPPIPRGMRTYERDFLADVEQQAERSSQRARRRLRMARVFALTALATTVAIPVSVSAGLPGWLAALFASIAAFAQGASQIRQDQRLSLESHVLAVELSDAARCYRRDFARRPATEREVMLDAFIDEVTRIRHDARPRIVEALRTPVMPSQVGSPVEQPKLRA